MTLSLIQQQYVDLVFPKMARALDKGLGKNTSLTVMRLYELCRNGSAFLFVDDVDSIRNALVCQFDEHRGKRVLVVLAMGGEGGQNWQQLFDEVCSWAKSLGAVNVTFEGRDGWAKVLKNVKAVRRIYVAELGA